MFDGVSSSGFCISRSTNEMLCSSQSGSTKGPSWGYHRLVLEAIGSFLSTFGENRPRFLKNLSKLTFEYPHEGPCVVTTRGRPLRISDQGSITMGYDSRSQDSMNFWNARSTTKMMYSCVDVGVRGLGFRI